MERARSSTSSFSLGGNLDLSATVSVEAVVPRSCGCYGNVTGVITQGPGSLLFGLSR
jgi:hypothetical protein